MRRRTFLHATGLSLVALPFLRLAGTARAETPSAGPTRLLVLFTPNGTIHDHWRPTGGEFDFSFPTGSILEPLAAWKDQLLLIDGMNFHEADNHEGGMEAMLTNNGGASTETAGMSLDQYVASRIGGTSRFASMELGVQTSLWGGSAQTRMSYAGPGSLVTPDDDPENVYARLYGDLAGSPEAAARRLARRQSILDLVNGELT
ncbi:MAG: DUF1552 domain-containing protein, partial [Myxococcota bacterium]